MNSSTAARNGEEGADPLRLKKSTNCSTDSCCSGVSELMTAARFSAAIFAFHPQYTLPRRWLPKNRSFNHLSNTQVIASKGALKNGQRGEIEAKLRAAGMLVWIDSSDISYTIRGFYPMPTVYTGLAKARHVFTKHGGMLRTSAASDSAFTRGRCTHSAILATSNGSVAVYTDSPPRRRFPVRISFQSRFEFHVRSSVSSRHLRITA